MARSTPEYEAPNTVLVHGAETTAAVTLARADGVVSWEPLWSSHDSAELRPLEPGAEVLVSASKVVIFWAVS
ncbi:MAG: hypothetical protein EON55_16670 [Alphaproteobacteria bacterium]|nr:MAG: hypothetical protein EON55_16670 [Alphaproteobacteria bacterium]